MFFKFTNERLKWSVIILGLLVSTLSLLHSYSGPRLVKASVEGDLSSARLIARFNQTLATRQPLEITISPEIKNSYSVRSTEVLIAFDEPLKSDTAYTIKIAQIEGLTKKKNEVNFVYTTLPQKIIYLQRNYTEDSDHVIMKTIGKPDEKSLYSDERIGNYAYTKSGKLFVLKDTSDKKLSTELIEVSGKNQTIITPPKGVVSSISASQFSEKLIVLTQDISTYTSYLFVYDAENNTFKEMTRNDGSPIDATQAEFAHDGQSIVYRDSTDGALMLTDPTHKREPLNFGIVYNFHRYLLPDKGIFFESKPGTYEFITNDGKVQTVLNDITTTEAKLENDLSSIVLLQNTYSDDNTHQVLLRKTVQGIKKFFETDTESAIIREVDLSPNDEYITYQQNNSPITFDGYRTKNLPKGVKTIIIDKTGKTIESLNGASITWL